MIRVERGVTMKFIEAKEIFRDADSRKGLPAWTYKNDELTQLEMEQVFLRNWMFVGHVSDLPERCVVNSYVREPKNTHAKDPTLNHCRTLGCRPLAGQSPWTRP